jgi:DNA-binding protein H-NS
MEHNQTPESMSVDELWSLHVMISKVLVQKISAEKERLEQRLLELGTRDTNAALKSVRARRPYPKVHPKYQNPDRPKETWAGRGKQPRWLDVQLRSGKNLEDFQIEASSDRRRRAR